MCMAGHRMMLVASYWYNLIIDATHMLLCLPWSELACNHEKVGPPNRPLHRFARHHAAYTAAN